MIFNVLVIILSGLWCAITAPVMVMPISFRIKNSVLFMKSCLFLLKITAGITYEVRGKIPSDVCIVASNHQSLLETIILLTVVKNPVYILKKELMWLPLVGLHSLALRMIFIDRKGGTTTIRRMLSAAKARVAEGRSIIIFPEGSRIPIGSQGQYQPGIAMLYKSLSLPVVPVALNTGLFFPKKMRDRKAGKVIIEILPSIAPGLDKQEFLQTLQCTIEKKSKELLVEAV